MEKENWLALMSSLGFSENEKEYEMIWRAYSQSQRAYHNTVHIKDCLAKCSLNPETRFNHQLHLAFWYHDLVYQPLKKNNELKSAEAAAYFLKKQSASPELVTQVNDLIMATLHNSEPKNKEEAFMMDIDISILGSDSETYATYTQNIRKEYKMVPWILYKKKRIEILKMFLNKSNLYVTDYFKNLFEEKARLNIQNEIAEL